MQSVTILTACYNEEDNVEALYERVRDIMARVGRYRYEHLFIDNASTDRTVAILKRLAIRDRNVKIIVNTRNFGQNRSPMYALSQAQGDAVIGLVADFQDPPELIPELLAAWEEGWPMVACVKQTSDETGLMFALRKTYYRMLEELSSIKTIQNYTGFGLYDRKVVDQVIALGDAEPYFRGMVAELGFPYKTIVYNQPVRRAGRSKNNLITLIDMALVGLVTHSKAPLRVMIFAGLICAAGSFLMGVALLVYKLLFWNRFDAGVAPLAIGAFMGFSVQLIFMGLLGEYIGAIHTQLQRRPWAVENERVNLEFEPGPAAAPRVEAPHLVVESEVLGRAASA
jgi:glycosyltransferase involved in cell wall biosynthesis